MEVSRINGLVNGQKTINKFFEPQGVKKETSSAVQTNPITKDASTALSAYFRAGQNIKPNFTGHYCPTKDFRVKQLEHIPCACCGKDMLTNDSAEKLANHLASVTGDDLVATLTDSLEYFRPDEKAVVRATIKNAEKSKKSTLSSAFPNGGKNNAEMVFKEGQKAVLSDVIVKADELYGKDNNVSKTAQDIIDKINRNKNVKREGILKTLRENAETLGNEENTHKITDVAISLPTDLSCIEKMISKYSGQDSKSIAIRLTNPAKMTAEHVHPHALGGPDNTANYIGECADCNNDRGTIPLDKWMEKYPDMPYNTQRYVDEVTDRIVKGEVGAHYDDYPIDVEKVMKTETQGVIKLKVKNPEEIDKIREEKGYAQPDESEPLPADRRKPKIDKSKIKR